MYTRSYNEQMDMPLPDGYGGTMLSQDDREQSSHEPEDVKASIPTMGWLSKLLPDGIGALLPRRLLSGFSLGTEELLIGAVALFLLFSKGGDRECAIMLILLLFVS